MKLLPWDYSRCNPDHPDGNCKTCRRWTGQPWQDYGPRTAVSYALENSSSEHCDYIPEKEDEVPPVQRVDDSQGNPHEKGWD